MNFTKSQFFSLHPGRRKLLGSAVYVGLLRFIQLCMGLAAMHFLAHGLTKKLFGEYQMILNSVGLLTFFSLTGLNNSVMQAVARGFHGTYRKVVPISFLSSLLGSLVLASMSGWYFWKTQESMATGLLIAAALFPFAYGMDQWKQAIAGEEDFKGLLKLDGLGTVITYCCIIAAISFYPQSYALPVVFVLLVPSLLNGIMTAYNFHRIPVDALVEKDNIAYGIKTTFYTGLVTAASYLDKLLLFFFLSPIALATYAAAERIPEFLRGVVQDLSGVLAPRLAKHNYYTQHVDKILRLFAIAYGICIILFAFTLLPPSLLLIFGQKYADAIPYAQALTCTVAIGNLASLRFRYIRSKTDVKSFRDVMLATTAVRIVSFLIFIPLLGLAGVVLSMFVYRISTIVTVHIIIKKHAPPSTV